MSQTSRRGFVKAVASWAAVVPMMARRQQTRQSSSSQRILAYVGTYSAPQGSGGGHGQGIHLYEMDSGTGALAERDVFRTPLNPSWLTLDSNRTHLYAANEVASPGTGFGSVSAYEIDRTNGHLTLLNEVSSEGAGPAHMSIHPSGKYALVANYGGGTVAVLSIESNGRLGSATDVKQDKGTPGPTQPSSAPPGSFAISGHDRSHAHVVQSDASGRFVFAADLGLDQILVWKFDDVKGTLTPNDPPSVALPPGDGPRHFVFHPNGRWFYSLQEEASTLVTFDYDAVNGRLRAKHTISTLPQGFAGTNFTAGILLSSDARFVYVSNRLHDSIAWFAIAADGTLKFVGEEWTRGDYPRSFNFDPTGRFLFSCNQRSDAVASFRVNPKTGALTFTGHYTPVGTPSHIVFLT
jgi:6-phosphogluconolactonase